MNNFKIEYNGKLRTTATHLDSGAEIITDAPKDNLGKGESFSPTDMICSAYASCILTIMAIAVEKNNISIKNTVAIVKKTMGHNPRRIIKIEIDLTFPREYDYKTNLLQFNINKNLSVGKHRFTLNLIDNVGNSTKYEADFTY